MILFTDCGATWARKSVSSSFVHALCYYAEGLIIIQRFTFCGVVVLRVHSHLRVLKKSFCDSFIFNILAIVVTVFLHSRRPFLQKCFRTCDYSFRVHSHLRFIRRELLREVFSPHNSKKTGYTIHN